MDIAVDILAFLLAIFVLVSIHEYGHFIVAKKLGIKVLRFSIGFGKPLWRRQLRDGGEFVVAWIPLGGYVKMLDSTQKELTAKERLVAFDLQPVAKRIAVVLAGPFMNFILGIFLFWLIYSIGFTVIKPVVGKVFPNTVAAKAGINPHDEFIKIDGRMVKSWQTVLLTFVRNIGDDVDIPVELYSRKDKQTRQVSLNLGSWKPDLIKLNLLKSVGIKPYFPPVPPVVEKVVHMGPAAMAGLKAGDRVVAVDNQPITSWQSLQKIIKDKPNQAIRVTVQRDSQETILPIELSSRLQEDKTIGFLGARPESITWPKSLQRHYQKNVFSAWQPALSESWYFFTFNFIVIGKLIVGKLSLQGLGGPISIFQTADVAFSQGFIAYLSFLGILSIMLGFVNVLPIPALDGGHFLYYVIEIVRRKALSMRAQQLGVRLGVILLVLILIHATTNDLMRIFS